MDNFWFVAAEDPSLERDLIVERESLPDKGGDAREGKTRQGETERLDKTQRRERTWCGPVDDTGSTEQEHALVPAVSTNKRENRTENGERPRSRSRSASSSLSDTQKEGEQSEKVPKSPAAFEKIAQQDKERYAGLGAEDEPAHITKKQKRTENRMPSD